MTTDYNLAAKIDGHFDRLEARWHRENDAADTCAECGAEVGPSPIGWGYEMAGEGWFGGYPTRSMARDAAAERAAAVEFAGFPRPAYTVRQRTVAGLCESCACCESGWFDFDGGSLNAMAGAGDGAVVLLVTVNGERFPLRISVSDAEDFRDRFDEAIDMAAKEVA